MLEGDVSKQRAVGRSRRHTGIADERFPALAVEPFDLGQILQHDPQLHPETCHQARRDFDRFHMAKDREFIEHHQHGNVCLRLGALESRQCEVDDDAQPAGMRAHPCCGQAQVQRRLCRFQF